MARTRGTESAWTAKAVVVTVAAVLTLGACGSSTAGNRAGSSGGGGGGKEGLLFIASPGRLSAVDGRTGALAFHANGAVAAPNWARLYTTEGISGGTRLVGLSPVNGREVSSQNLDEPDLVVRAVSKKADLVALGPPPGRSGYFPSGRATTTLMVVRPLDDEPRRYDLPGNLAPEAFTEDRSSVFVISYTPPEAPDHYQVRRLDLSDGRLHDVFSIDAHLQQTMGGTARTQVMSPDGRRLYTLYSQTDGGPRRAFVHVLSLDEKWAHCVDLPDQFADAVDGTAALAVSPDGRQLYVMSATNGAVAQIDTEKVAVARTTTVQVPATAAVNGPPSAALAVDGQGHLYAGLGSEVVTLSTKDLSSARSWSASLTSAVSAIQTSSDGSRLYLGMPTQVVVVNAIDGTWSATIPVAGAVGITRTGVAPAPALPAARGGIECAC